MTSGRTFNIISETVRNNCIKCVQDAPNGMQVTIREKSKSRDQEAYLHVILDAIEDYTGQPADDVKTHIKIPILGYDTYTENGEVYRVVKSSKNIPVKTYNKLIDAALMICHDLGIVVQAPSFYGYDIRGDK